MLHDVLHHINQISTRFGFWVQQSCEDATEAEIKTSVSVILGDTSVQ